MTPNDPDRRAARVAAVAGEFEASWEAITRERGWWPGRTQVELTRMLADAGSVAAAVERDEFVRLLRRSLNQWKAFRGVSVSDEHLARVLRDAAPAVDRLRGTTIAGLRRAGDPRLFEAFDAVRDLRPSARKWVATSKTLHHLLPDLIVPMDNMLTAPFLGRASLPDTFDAEVLQAAYASFLDLRDAIGVSRLRGAAREVPYPVAGARLAECRVGSARVIDVAIAGYVVRHGARILREAQPAGGKSHSVPVGGASVEPTIPSS